MDKPEENLHAPLTKILEGIEEFNRAVSARFASGDYRSSHLLSISHTRTVLLNLVPELTDLKRQVLP